MRSPMTLCHVIKMGINTLYTTLILSVHAVCTHACGWRGWRQLQRHEGWRFTFNDSPLCLTAQHLVSIHLVLLVCSHHSEGKALLDTQHGCVITMNIHSFNKGAAVSAHNKYRITDAEPNEKVFHRVWKHNIIAIIRMSLLWQWC